MRYLFCIVNKLKKHIFFKKIEISHITLGLNEVQVHKYKFKKMMKK